MSKTITRRGFALGGTRLVGSGLVGSGLVGTGLVAASGLGLTAPALAQSEPLRIGWLAAMTGPSSAPAIGFNRGVVWAAETINAAGGVKGRKLEIITRRHPGRPDQGGERDAGDDQPAEGACRLGPDQQRREPGHDSHPGPRQDAEHPPLRGGHA